MEGDLRLGPCKNSSLTGLMKEGIQVGRGKVMDRERDMKEESKRAKKEKKKEEEK